MDIDLHGYHPSVIVGNGTLTKIVQQAWEMGETQVKLIHGHGRMRGMPLGFVNTNTGLFGLQIRHALRHDHELRRWIKHTTLNCSHPGATTIGLKPNAARNRTHFDEDLFPEHSYQR